MELVTIYFDELIHTTAEAKLYQIEDQQVWIPISQIEDENDDWFEIPYWLALDKGLI